MSKLLPARELVKLNISFLIEDIQNLNKDRRENFSFVIIGIANVSSL